MTLRIWFKGRITLPLIKMRKTSEIESLGAFIRISILNMLSLRLPIKHSGRVIEYKACYINLNF